MKKLRQKLPVLVAILALVCLFATGCGEETDTKTPSDNTTEQNPATQETVITEKEATAYFEEITTNVYYHLLETPVDELKTGIDPYYWIWLAKPAAEGGLEELSEPYITQEEKDAHTGDGYQLSYAAYAKNDIQKGLDGVWGQGNITCGDIIKNLEEPSVIVTENYLLAAQGFGGPYNQQFFQIKEVTCDGATAVVHAYVLEQNHMDGEVFDLSSRTVTETSNTNGMKQIHYQYKSLGSAGYQDSASVESLLHEVNSSLDALGVVDFTLKKDGNGLHLVSIDCSQS